MIRVDEIENILLAGSYSPLTHVLVLPCSVVEVRNTETMSLGQYPRIVDWMPINVHTIDSLFGYQVTVDPSVEKPTFQRKIDYRPVSPLPFEDMTPDPEYCVICGKPLSGVVTGNIEDGFRHTHCKSRLD